MNLRETDLPSGGCSLTVRFEPGVADPLPPNFAAARRRRASG
jgi:hypothetical protein